MTPKPQPTQTVLASLLASVAIVLASPAITWAAERAPVPRWPIVLLPFAREGTVTDESAPDVLYENVSHALHQVRALRMLETGAAEKAMQAAGASRGAPLTDRQLAEIVAGTKARAAITGTVRQDGDGVRLALRFVEAPSRGEVGLAGEASGPAGDLFPLGERATQGILKTLKVRPSPLDEKRLAAAFRKPTQNVAAYTLYARGSWALGVGTRQGYETATDLFGKALELDGNFALARYRLGLALQATNNRWKAVGEFRKAIQIDPNFAEAYKALGDLLRLSPRRLYDQAIEAYSKAIDLQPDFAEAYVGRGDAWQAKGNHDNAIAEYRKTIDLDPENARVRVSLGRIYYNEKGQYHEAVAEYNRAIQLEPTLLEAHLALGEVYEEKGLYQDAIARYGKVLEIEPLHPTAHYGLALAYEKVDREKSIAMWEKYIEIASTSPTEKEWLEIARKHLKKLKEQQPAPAR